MIYLDDPNNNGTALVEANWLRFLNNDDPVKVKIAQENKVLP